MKQPSSGAPLATLYTLTLFLSAALLFLVQPMFGKMVLPRFGGAPAVWNTCQVFFQAALLAGYLYAHFVGTWLALRWQVMLHTLVLLLPLVSLPIVAATGWNPAGDANPVPSLIGLLAVSVGLPFVVVSTTAPLLQAWFSRSRSAAAADPYFLYAASNAGSLLALLAYPLIVERALPLSVHGQLWSGGYLLLAGLVVTCGAIVWRSSAAANSDAPAERSPAHLASPAAQHLRAAGVLIRLRWLALALVPSSLMLSVTLHLTTDVAAVPLLWVIPLAIYLMTFVLAFARRQWLPHALAARAMPLVVLALAIALISQATHPVWLLMTVHLVAFFVMSLVCHGELARLRPPAYQLTEFYLWLSLGGILGGVFSALIAPLLFRTVIEYPFMIVAACLLRPAPPTDDAPPSFSKSEIKRSKKQAALAAPEAAPRANLFAAIDGRFSPGRLDWLLPLGLGLTTAAITVVSRLADLNFYEVLALGFGAPAIVCYLFLYRPVRFALGVGALLLASYAAPSMHGRVLHVERSFFGVHRVTIDPGGKYIQLVHGNTVHGKQRLAGPSTGGRGSPNPGPGPVEPLNYYHRSGPIGDVFELPQVSRQRLPVGVVGLGTGTLAAYAKSGQELDFYEIDPVVRRIAENGRYFTFLKKCQGRYRILLGDARLKLGQAPQGRYGLIVLDAFSSDAVPLHLITREAVKTYMEKLSEHGVLAFHVSNRYLDLPPVLSGICGELGLTCLVRADLDSNLQVEGHDSSIWVVAARSEAALAGLPRQPAPHDPLHSLIWTGIARTSPTVWTDDEADLFSAWRSDDGS